MSTIALQLKNFSKQGKCAKVPTMFILIKTRKSGQLLHQSGGQEAIGRRAGGRRQPPPDGDSFPAPPLRAGDAAGHNV